MANDVVNVVENVMRNVTRNINGLADENRNTRKRALEGIRKETLSGTTQLKRDELQEVFDQLVKPLLKILSDPVEKCRQLSVDLIAECVKLVQDPSEYLSFVVPVLTQRLGQPEIVELSEELRLSLVKLLTTVVELCQKRMAPYLDDLIKILERTIMDPFPEVKKASCQCASLVAKTIPEQFHMQSETLIKPLLCSVSHQHSRVRIEVIKSIGMVLQYGNGKSVEDVVSHLAQRLFDSSPAVRLAVMDVVGGWLLDLMDRYSFHARLLPLLLTGLTDDMPDIRSRAEALWHDVGLKYEDENENDLKDKQDFVKSDPENYPPNIERPNLGCRTLVYRHFSKIVVGIVNDLCDWVVATRVKASALLYTLLLHEEENVTQHLPRVLGGLYRAAGDEEAAVAGYVMQSAELIGYFVKPEVWCKMILSNAAQTSGALSVLPAVVRRSSHVAIHPYLHDICSVIVDPQVCHFADGRVLTELVACVDSIVTVAVGDCAEISYDLFTLLITVLALQKSPLTSEKVHSLLGRLAAVQGLAGADALYERHTPSLVAALQGGHDTWTQHSVERLIFDALLLNAGAVIVGEHFSAILPTFCVVLAPEKEPELRLKFFALLSRLVAATTAAPEATRRRVEAHAGDIVRRLIVPNCVWAAGRVAAAVRTTAIGCLWALLDSSVITTHTLLSVGPDLLPQLRAALDDSSQPTRLLSCRCVRRVLVSAGSALCRDQLHAMYPDLLKRLDDSSDDVRIAVAATFAAYVDCLASGGGYDVALYRAHLEEMHGGLLVHLDDPEPAIQEAVLEVLKKTAQIETEMLLEATSIARPRHRSTAYCDRLIDYIHTLNHASS